MLDYEKKHAFFLASPCGSGEESFAVLDDNKRIIYLTLKKDEDLEFLRGKDYFEFNGISKFSKEFLSEMFKLHEEKMKTGSFDEYHEECALVVNKQMPLYGLVDTKAILAEVDNKKDIERAKQVIEKLRHIE